MLLTMLVKGFAASCNWLCYARSHHFLSSLQELQCFFPVQTAMQGNRQPKGSGEMEAESFDGFRRAPAPASTKG